MPAPSRPLNLSNDQPKAKRKIKLLPRSYSAREIAKIIGVSYWTTNAMCDRGDIKSYRIGSRRDRRVTHLELLRWLREHGMDEHVRAMVMSRNPVVVLTKLPEIKAQCVADDLLHATCWIDLGIMLAESQPRGVVMDSACGQDECVQTAMRLHNEYHKPTICIIVYDGTDPQVAKSGLFDVKVRFPDEIGTLPQIIQHCNLS